MVEWMLVLPAGGVVNDVMPQSSSTLDMAFFAVPDPGASARELSVRQVKHRATHARMLAGALDERGADLSRVWS